MSERNPLSAGARRRRETFPIAEDAFVNFSSKPPFADLDPEVLELYVEAGFEPIPPDEGATGKPSGCDAGGRTRRRSMPTVPPTAPSSICSEIGCHVTLCCGEDTDAFGVSLLEADAGQLPTVRPSRWSPGSATSGPCSSRAWWPRRCSGR